MSAHPADLRVSVVGRLLALAVVALALLVTLGHTPRPVDAQESIELAIVDVDDGNFPTVQLVLTADAGGRPLQNISPAELAVFEGGRTADVTSIARASDAGTPLALVVAIDTSGSMEGANLSAAQGSARTLIESLSPGDAAALLAFAGEVQTLQGLTGDTELLSGAIDSLIAEGDTALYEAVGAAGDVARASSFARRAVVLISDGEDFGERSALTREETLLRAAEGAVLFYTIGVGPEVDRDYLESLASESGGRSFLVNGPEEIGAIYASIEELLRSQFVVTIDSHGDAAAIDRSIEVMLTTADGVARASRAYESIRPPAPATPAPTPVAATPTPVVEPPPAPASSGSGFSPVLVGSAVLLLALAAAAVALWRRRSTAFEPALVASAYVPASTRSAVKEEAPGAVLVLTGAGGDQRFLLTERPLRIGAADRCEVRVPAADGVGGEHARVWLRDGRAMLHHVAEHAVTRINGSSASWASLRDGDEIEVGANHLRYLEAASPD